MPEPNYGQNADLAAERDAILALPPDQMQRALLAFSQRRSGAPEMPGGYREPTEAGESGAWTGGLTPATGRFAANIVPGAGADAAKSLMGKDEPQPAATGTTPPSTLSPALQSIFGRMSGRIEEDVGLARQQGEIQQRQAGERATGARDAQRGLAEAERAAAEQFRSRPIPAFIPTQDTAADMGTLFSLLAVAGQALGGKGKTGAMTAMASMTGMLNGWRQGRQDLYEKERRNFEAGLRQIQAQNQALQEMYTRATRAAQTDMQGALAEAERRAIELGAPLAALAARRSGNQGLNTIDQSYAQVVSQLESRVQAARQAEEVRKRTREDNVAAALERDIRTAGPATDYLYRQFNTFIPKAPAEAIVSTARAIGEGLSIADAANSLPENMGRSGQLRGFIERYLTSSADAVRNNQPPPATGLTEAEQRALPEGEQNALLFAKRYASYLVNYERQLAGGARGFTVSFQNRFNSLMAQNQFSRQGFVDLMKQHVQELSQGAQQPGVPQLDFNRLARMGIDLHNQGSAPDDRGSAQRGLELIMRPRTAEAPRAAPPGPPSGDVQARQRAAAAARASGGTAAPAATYNSLEDLRAAVSQGTLTREQAFAIAEEKGFN
jgi:hypothetical protein